MLLQIKVVEQAEIHYVFLLSDWLMYVGTLSGHLRFLFTKWFVTVAEDENVTLHVENHLFVQL
jgi:hypothetical protein